MQNRILFRLLLLGQFLLFLILFVVGLYLFAMSISNKTDPDAVGGMQRSSAICLLISPLWLIPAIGIRRKAPWAWWLGFVVNLAGCLFLSWAFNFDPSAMIFPAVFLVLTILHLSSRPTTWRVMDLPKYPSFAKKSV
jgi:hypothetical protein